ncbi:MAG: SUMF1/EgtB/PvdO family nonheme iron enzyme [Desulfobulbaceae bacterium]|nr:SUMF1/EgtB/PvdO family nonheme iron enzyme [Pseudomonadota bacterium]MCG2746717.1 SUMF1/EgtB/PvdO family nonheme iron enzyme [Desulfobulbaceae bacterium]
MIDIFISYASEDRARASQIAAALEARGWTVFWDRTIPAGKTWRDYIGAALEEARCVLVMWSKASIVSTWVQEEADSGRERGVLVPVFIEAVKPPLGFRLIQAQDLTGWDGEASAPAFAKLAADLADMLGVPPAIESSEADVTQPLMDRSRMAAQQSVAPGARAETYQDPITGMEFVWVEGGCFQMGDTFGDGDTDEKPVHEVCVDGFYMGKYAVTQGQWEKIMVSNPSEFKSGDDFPVENVSWDDTQEFIGKLNAQTGKKYRLPTEAEWEYAARSGGKKEKYAGGNNAKAVAWYEDNSRGKTHRVGTKNANGLGLHDMSGNVWEWCQDWFDKGYYSSSPRNNPQGPSSGSYRVDRGGSWRSLPGGVRAANRDRGAPDYRLNYLGFRLVLPPGQ